MAGLAIVTPLAVPVVFGEKWTAAVTPVRWLSLFMIIRTLGTLTEQVLISQRMTRLTMRMSILNFLVMPVAFVVGAYWRGMGGVAGAWLALSPVMVAPLVIILLRRIQLPLRQYLTALATAVAGSVVMCVAVLAARQWLLPPSWSPKLALAAQVGIGGAVYSIVLLSAFRPRILRYVRFVKDLRGKKANSSAAVALAPLPMESE